MPRPTRSDLCNGCRHLTREEAPKGAAFMRCMRPGEKCGRVVNYSSVGLFDFIYTPKWCDCKEEEKSAVLDQQTEVHNAQGGH